MSGKSLALWVVVPFVLLSAVALWLSRGGGAGAPARPAPALPSPALPAPDTRPAVQEPAAPAPPPPAPAAAGAGDPLTPGAESEAQVDLGDAGPTGTVDRDALRAAVEAARPLLRQCFLDVTERYPGPQTVRLRFTLEGQGTAGRLRNAEVAETSIQDPFLLACFVDALEDVQFPAPRGGPVTVTYPFRYKAGPPAPAPAPDAGQAPRTP